MLVSTNHETAVGAVSGHAVVAKTLRAGKSVLKRETSLIHLVLLDEWLLNRILALDAWREWALLSEGNSAVPTSTFNALVKVFIELGEVCK